MKTKNNNFTRKIMMTLLLGLGSGVFVILIRESLVGNGLENIWSMINNFLFADITAVGNEKSIGLFLYHRSDFLKTLTNVTRTTDLYINHSCD